MQPDRLIEPMNRVRQPRWRRSGVARPCRSWLGEGLSQNPPGFLICAVTPELLPMGKDYLGDILSLSLNSLIRHVHHVDKKIVLTRE